MCQSLVHRLREVLNVGGRLMVRPGELVVVQRGIKYKVRYINIDAICNANSLTVRSGFRTDPLAAVRYFACEALHAIYSDCTA